jgi:hypothetical protein
MKPLRFPTVTLSMAPRSERQAGRARSGWSRSAKVLAASFGIVAGGGVAFAATNWTVGLASGSGANAQGSSIQNLTFTNATTAPSLSNALAPGGTGDVSVKITNPNPFVVTVTAVTIPAETLTTNSAVGYSDPALSSAISGCGVTTSTVWWKGAGASPVSKAITPVTVAGGATITLTLTSDAQMDSTAPLACAGTSSGSAPNLTYAGAYFVMPSLTTITATGGVYAGQPATTANGGSATSTY